MPKFTKALLLPGDPVVDLAATPKQYVDHYTAARAPYTPKSGDIQLPSHFIGAVTAAGDQTSGYVNFTPFDVGPLDFTLQSMRVNTTTSQVGGTVTAKLGIYLDDGSGGAPLISAGGRIVNVSVAALTGTAGARDAATSQVLTPGRYWAAFGYFASVAPSTAPRFTVINASLCLSHSNASGLGSPIRGWSISGATDLPTSGTLAAIGNTANVLIGWRRA